jgi:pimeloyl-ACP methyl ester carboxylesterase
LDKKTPHIYLISGLGADYRVFQKLNLPSNHTHINWIDPISNSESIQEYTKRLGEQITHKNPILIGISFGGMIAIEMGKIIDTEKIILISSVKTKQEIPLKYRLFGASKLNKITPEWILNKSSFLLYYMFGVKSTEGKKLLKQIILDTDTHFMKWAINQLVNWENETTLNNIIHIHGNKDKLISVKSVKANHIIKDGGHLAVYENHKKVNEIIINEIN